MAPEVACDFVTETTCVDASPPPRTDAVLDYWVVAIDKDPQDQQREGAPSNRVDVNAPNLRRIRRSTSSCRRTR